MLGMDPYGGNVGVSSFAVSLWQLGLWGIPFLVFTATVTLVIINVLLRTGYFLYVGLAYYWITLPTLSGLFSNPDVFILQGQRVLLFWLLIRLILRRQTRRRLPIPPHHR